MLAKNFTSDMERRWQTYWQEQGIYAFNEADMKSPIYSIDTPPPFTSGELHMGHVLSYSFFDFIARYKRMSGFNVYYPQGWDCQGFPTEVKVEQKFGRLPPVQFREKCVEWTKEFIERMKNQMITMGFSADWALEYRTMAPDYHRKVQLSLIEMYDKKFIYRGEYPVYWCPKCVSAIAKAELDDEEKNGILYTIQFSLADGKPLPIATSRPELFPACVAVLYHPDDERYKNLTQKTVTTPLGKEVPLLADKDVDPAFGTGAVQVCTFGDKMDVIWMHRHKLPLISCIDPYGKMQNAGELNGLKAAEARKKLVEKLASEGRVLSQTPLQQTVKVHDRCKTLVELIPSKQWFADIRKPAKAIKDMAHQINWVPDFGITYLIDWVEGAEWDWVISRQRVFGTPLPFYYCESCHATKPAQIRELPFYAEKAPAKTCACGQPMKPETSTCDCWVDSSITPMLIAGWPDNPEKFKRLYPISLRPQGVEIVRTWAFYTLYRSGVALTGLPPWRTILLNGNVLAPDGKKMSKSLGNIISPSQLQQEYPVDAIRQWAAMSGAMAKDRPFSYEDIRYAKTFLNKLWNASRLAETALKDYDGSPIRDPGIIDRWMLARMNIVLKDYTAYFEKFEYHHALGLFYRFFWDDFCANYLEYIKHRIYGSDVQARRNAQCVLRSVVWRSLHMLAPFAPHISEEVFQELFPREGRSVKSIHLSRWPESETTDDSMLSVMETFNKIIVEIRQHKAKNKMAQNAELPSIRLSLETPLNAELTEELKAVAKIREIKQEKGEFRIEL